MPFCNTRILFILKRRDLYGDYDHREFPCLPDGSPRLTSGLFNSAMFVEKMLAHAGIFCKLVEVVDNNDIDREVHKYQPTHVIIEGLWVVPDKFTILAKLHPMVQWIVRLHSEIPFLSMEGIAIDWIIKYMNHPSVIVAGNAVRTVRDLRHLVNFYHPEWNEHKVASKIILLPNYYPTHENVERKYNERRNEVINIGCFGAVRPLKNQLAQAMAAIKYAKQHDRFLKFHMNGSRNEQGGDSNFKNILALFDGVCNELVLYPWMPHEEFLLVVAQMDVSLCVSFSETFCIVAADTVDQRVPLVASNEVPWCSHFSYADPNDIDSIENAIGRVLNPITRSLYIAMNHRKLVSYCNNTREIWIDYFKK